MLVSYINKQPDRSTLSGTRVSHGIDRVEVSFDDPNLVANAGLLLTATVADRLGLEALIDATVKLGSHVGSAAQGARCLRCHMQ